jgi:hypothetical protein
MNKTTNTLILVALINNMTLVDMLNAVDEAKDQGDWQPANGGSEVPFTTRSGKRLLYCWQPTTGRHAYLDMDSDIILTDEEAGNYLQMR